MIGIGAFVLTRGLASVEQYTTAMASFRGVMRRLDRQSDRTSVQMFEGFGSSYEGNAGRSSQDGKRGAFGFAGLVFDLDACTLKREPGEVVALTRGEFALLHEFASARRFIPANRPPKLSPLRPTPRLGTRLPSRHLRTRGHGARCGRFWRAHSRFA